MCSWFLFLLRFILAPIAGTDQEMDKTGTGYAVKWGQATQSPISTIVEQTSLSLDFIHVLGNETPQ
jgi:hypothetical protein